jgi:hypothetical protein
MRDFGADSLGDAKKTGHGFEHSWRLDGEGCDASRMKYVTVDFVANDAGETEEGGFHDTEIWQVDSGIFFRGVSVLGIHGLK